MKYIGFLRIARLLNGLGATPLLFGSLGLEKRLGQSLHADDIDVLVPKRLLGEDWPALIALMAGAGYALIDLHEHEFALGEMRVAFAALEELAPFAGVDIAAIPLLEEDGARFLLPELPDWLKVYRASSRDGYRRDVRHKKDADKIRRIEAALAAAGRGEKPC